jgi:prepilin-type N-terminal cleavage/methylation domain-containing protein
MLNRVTDDGGFTLVEVLVAISLLLVGTLGVVTMVTGANAQTAVTKSREGATNLSREVIDAARGVDYDSLTSAGIVSTLQAQPGLGDSDPSLAGWQINRRGVVYTIASLPICIIDGQADGYGAHPAPSDPAAPGYCTGQHAPGTVDPNPDDFRRMDVTITWATENHNYSLRETTLIINPSGGIGPSVKSLCRVQTSSDAACPATTPAIDTSLNFLALTSVADTTTWTVDDGSNPVDVSTSNPSAPTGTAWNFTWNIGTPTSEAGYSCGMNVNWTLDGNYIVTAQAISGIGANGVPGQLKPNTVTLNRSVPYRVCGLKGGFDQMPDPQPAGHPTAVDLEWTQNQERDVIGYHVYRIAGGSDASDKLICDTTGATGFPFTQSGCICTSQTSCLDTNPRNTGATVTYRVTAVDRDDNGNPRDSNLQTSIDVDQSSDTAPAFGPGSVTETSAGGEPVISWPAATDSDGILYYRIYRNGTAYVNRYDLVPGTATSYTDPNPSASGDTYWVTAVDTRYDESQPVQAVAP